MNDNTYGVNKRINFIAEVIAELKPSSVLDVGCGTGSNLTKPLAELFPDINFIGIDDDSRSIDYGVKNNKNNNLTFCHIKHFKNTKKFDLIIASEVIEHVENPHNFLLALKKKLKARGRIILTLPNGVGAFELASLAESLLYLSGLYGLIRKFKRMILGNSYQQIQFDTLAVSPHINFFTFKTINRLINFSGLKVVKIRNRTFLCGFIFDHFIVFRTLISINALIADYLPPSLVSAWMFVLQPGAINGRNYNIGPYGKLRRYLNKKRWQVK